MRIILGIAFFVLTLTGFSQDLIVKKDGVKIYCEIRSVDSLSIVYIKAGLKQIYQINRTEVDNYFMYNPKGKNLNKDTSANSNPNPYNEKVIVGLNYGFANAISDFGSKDLENKNAGLANNGKAVSLNLVVKVSKNIGFKAIYLRQSNAFDADIVEKYFTSRYPGVNFDVTTENWLVKGFFAGIHFTTSFKTERRLFFNFDIIGGLPKCYLPKLTIKGFNQNGSVSESFGSSEKSAPAFMPTMGFRYYASNKFIINFDLSYLYTKVTFSDVSYSNTLGTRGLSKVTQKISTLNALFGISFVLD